MPARGERLHHGATLLVVELSEQLRVPLPNDAKGLPLISHQLGFCDGVLHHVDLRIFGASVKRDSICRSCRFTRCPGFAVSLF